jgi:GNAT superfamily N-acetyltransferase
MADALVRPAGPQDASVLGRLQLEVWQQAYSDLLPAAALLADPAQQGEIWASRLRAPGVVLIAFEGGEPVGLAAVDPELEDGMGHVELLHVLPRWSRRGHGGRLLGAAAAELRRLGAERGAWWAPETDDSVQRFLLGVGWVPDGRRRVLDTGEGTFAEIRYTGDLHLIVT